MNFHKKQQGQGFTLIELMVAVSIFSIIMVMSMGAVFSIVEANRKSRSLKSAMNNLNLVVETISRNVKFGTNWSVQTNGITFQDRFTLPNRALQTVSYRHNATNGSIERSISGAQFESITSPEININRFNLTVQGVPSGDGLQPFVILQVGGIAGTRASNQTTFDLQSAISQRELE
ncbi:MAG: hypothetical protein RJA61_627 [Candidatus Parcubacteria bacterium]|jgi:prepilin-type N-terminal cleavage/methylation domain-containing protein